MAARCLVQFEFILIKWLLGGCWFSFVMLWTLFQINIKVKWEKCLLCGCQRSFMNSSSFWSSGCWVAAHFLLFNHLFSGIPVISDLVAAEWLLIFFCSITSYMVYFFVCGCWKLSGCCPTVLFPPCRSGLDWTWVVAEKWLLKYHCPTVGTSFVSLWHGAMIEFIWVARNLVSSCCSFNKFLFFFFFTA